MAIKYRFFIATQIDDLYPRGITFGEIELDSSIQLPLIITYKSPLSTANAICPEKGLEYDFSSTEAEVKLTIDQFSLEDLGKPGSSYLKKYEVEITLNGIPEEIATYISAGQAPDGNSTSSCNYCLYAAASLALSSYSRLVRYARNKRQTHPAEMLTDDNSAGRLISDSPVEIAINEGAFSPAKILSYGGCIPVVFSFEAFNPTESSAIQQSDLVELTEFVKKDRNTNATNEFLVNAHRLWSTQQYRSGVLEAYAAVECAIRNIPKDRPSILAKNHSHIASESLASDINRFGVSKTIKYLIPLILPDINKDGLLNDIIQLDNLRQNVSHQAARKLKPQEVRNLIISAERFCDLLGASNNLQSGTP